MNRILASVLLAFSVSAAAAQEGITATGGNASGSGGSSSYSAGQIASTTQGDTGGTVARGVQVPYELSVRTGFNKSFINLQLQAYPNPTADFLLLEAGNAAAGTLHFELYDAGGKLLEKRRISCASEKICMDHLPPATYLLKVTEQVTEVKTFKIIKNQ